MITYVVTGLVVVVLLVVSYRALSGGGGRVDENDLRRALARLLGRAGERSAELDAALSPDQGPPASAPARRTDNSVPRESARFNNVVEHSRMGDPQALVTAAERVRKQVAGYAQQLTQLETLADPADQTSLDAARTLLAAALDDLVWACRLLETGRARDNPGLREAVDVLRGHARRCLDEAAAVVPVPQASASTAV